MPQFDAEAYHSRVLDGPCFVCRMLDGDADYRHEIVYEDDEHVAFLDRYPTLFGKALVAPRRHIVDTIGELSEAEYLAVQAVVHRVARALVRAVPTERTYVLSLGSNQGNAHVHWHLAPLPPGVPYDRQQYHALMPETAGVLDLSEAEAAALAERIRRELSATDD